MIFQKHLSRVVCVCMVSLVDGIYEGDLLLQPAKVEQNEWVCEQETKGTDRQPKWKTLLQKKL